MLKLRSLLTKWMTKLRELKGQTLVKTSLVFAAMILLISTGWYVIYAGNNAKKSLSAADQSSNSELGLPKNTDEITTAETDVESDPKTSSQPKPPPVASSPKTPCASASSSPTSATCTVNVSRTRFALNGVPYQQNGMYTSEIAGEVIIECSSENSCFWEGATFTKKVFNRDGYTSADGTNHSYPALIYLDIQQPTRITVTVPHVLETSYSEPFCKGCVTYYNHVFKMWTFYSNSQDTILTANYTSTSRH